MTKFFQYRWEEEVVYFHECSIFNPYKRLGILIDGTWYNSVNEYVCGMLDNWYAISSWTTKLRNLLPLDFFYERNGMVIRMLAKAYKALLTTKTFQKWKTYGFDTASDVIYDCYEKASEIYNSNNNNNIGKALILVFTNKI